MSANKSFEATGKRAQQLKELLYDSIPQLIKFVDSAEQERASHIDALGSASDKDFTSSLAHTLSASPASLEHDLKSQGLLEIPSSGSPDLHQVVETILKYSVNPTAPGFLDKLYAAPLPPGVLAELVLGVLNTNLHVYHVSPVLSLIEKHVTKQMAQMFGLDCLRSGGISVQGGSASNMTSIVIARNTLFPKTKVEGNHAVKGQLLLFTSAHGHYSIEKAAQALGLGTHSVVDVPVDGRGSMLPAELDRLICEAKEQGKRPFYINATAGSTVLGSFDPFEEISRIALKHSMWMHVDGAWGGSFVFSRKPKVQEQLRGINLADSIATNPHKMLGVPVTCSFLLGKDLRHFQQANTLKAGYLFHDADDSCSGNVDQDVKPNDETTESKDIQEDAATQPVEGTWDEPYDLADLTLQCGRRGDSLKFFFCLKYYGVVGYTKMVDDAYATACLLSKLVDNNADLTPVLARGSQPSCLQVCFWFTPAGKFTFGLLGQPSVLEGSDAKTDGQADKNAQEARRARLGKLNSNVSSRIAKSLISRGFMIDFAPALEGQEDHGSFFRVVVNIGTAPQTVRRLLDEIVVAGKSITATLRP